ncbi:NADH dehydrogenase [Breznakibacter xylanolyticus]|uniref:NADH:ubiquinone reductase (non-electrogenic) n=1 Tax=Breznakibacter xylanolyticus TaxID=990 RepID=A0A2W7N8Y5_9BACT|nr:NAD(P)/FAD-dependent oxidoreductase [Breznakibacter xylanolyticus]PZX16865.1 NADH dehydrogenase [Breznakibacter xylanolyticus]
MLQIPETNQKRIVIVGGGFAGISLAKSLAHSNYQVVMIDKNNYHQFQPLFYQVATAGIEPSAILFPLRKLFQRQGNAYLRITEVTGIDPTAKMVHTRSGDCHYDYLVVAAGAQTSYFGLKNIEAAAFPMKSVTEALTLRNSILNHLENALLEKDKAVQQQLLNLVIVGGGPTGTEVAGALAEMKKHIFPKEYRELDTSRIRIVLIEAAPRLLGGMSPKSSSKSLRYLHKLGVEVYLDTQVNDYTNHEVVLSNGERIPTRTLIWAAGIKGASMPGIPAEAILPNGRIRVDAFHRMAGSDTIFVVGDHSAMITDATPKGHPQVAQVAIQQARNLARNFIRMQKHQNLRPFRYRNPGSLATVGRHLAVADLPGITFFGFFAWYVWMFVHLMAILGVKNRLFVFLNWLWSYITFDQSLRLIIHRDDGHKLNGELT